MTGVEEQLRNAQASTLIAIEAVREARLKLSIDAMVVALEQLDRNADALLTLAQALMAEVGKVDAKSKLRGELIAEVLDTKFDEAAFHDWCGRARSEIGA